jgi:hypothetical protein
METSVTVTVTFTPGTKKRHPQLAGWRLATRFPGGADIVTRMQIGDGLRLQGVPVAAPLFIVARQWEMTTDTAELTLVLSTNTSLRPDDDQT